MNFARDLRNLTGFRRSKVQEIDPLTNICPEVEAAQSDELIQVMENHRLSGRDEVGKRIRSDLDVD